jgi:beta-glucosidase
MRLWKGVLVLGVVSVAVVLAAGTVASAPQQLAYLDPAQPLDRRVDDLLSRLTLAEKASLLGTTAPGIDRLKIPIMNGWNQSLHGIVWTQPTTMFPVPIGMAATWNTELEQLVASAIADEGRAVNNYWPTIPAPNGTCGGTVTVDCTAPSNNGQLLTRTAQGDYRHNGLVYRSPVINISRHPLWGRIDEAFGEDPYLTSRMTVAFVKGTHGDHPRHLKLATTLKHYAVNNQEFGRRGLSATVSERMLMEYYLPHFKAGIVEGGATSIMSSYNAINSVISTENPLLLRTILRDAWKFQGFVVPDSGAVEDLSIRAYMKYATLEEGTAAAIKAGGDLDNSAFIPSLPAALSKGLLTEQDVNQSLRRVLRVRFRLGEFDPSSSVSYTRIPPSVIDSHRELALRAARESIVLLTNRNTFLPLDRSRIKTVAVIGPHGSTPFTGIGYTGQASKFVVPVEGIKNRAAAGTEVFVVEGAGLPARGGGAGGGANRGGGAGRAGAGNAPAAAGATAPNTPTAQAGAQAPAAQQGRGGQRGGGGPQPTSQPPAVTPDINENAVADAVAAAKRADVAILFVGTNGQIEAEGRDRTYLTLPPNQEDLVRRVIAANSRTVVVLLNGGPVAVPFAKENAAAVLDMFIAGEEGGNAIADVLFGNYNPGGRLPYTVYASHTDVPPMTEYDITKGFTYMYFDGMPVYPFGHGLSYTTFAYSNLNVSPGSMTGNSQATVRVNVRNTGKMAGDEVVQLYVRDVEASVKRPKAELRGFQRVSLKPGEQRTVTFTLPAEKLAFWDETRHAFVTEPGAFEVMVGSSSADIKVRGQIHVTSAGQWGN